MTWNKGKPNEKKYLIILFVVYLLSSCSGDNESADIIEGNELVYINNGSIQCETQGVSADETTQQLLDVGVGVVFSYCGYLTGVGVQAQCGANEFDINLHEINSQDLAVAELLGFSPVSVLDESSELGYVLVDCPE